MPGYLDGWAIDVENGFGLVERAKIVLAFGLPVLTVGIVLSALWAAGAAVVAMVLGRWRRWRVANGADRLKSVWSIVGRRPTGAGLGRAGAVAVRSGMLGLGVLLEVPGADEPLAAVDRAALLLPTLTGVVETEQHVRLGPTNLRASLLERSSRGYTPSCPTSRRGGSRSVAGPRTRARRRARSSAGR